MYQQSFVYACSVNGGDRSETLYNKPPPFLTQKRLHECLYPADRITDLVSVISYTVANYHIHRRIWLGWDDVHTY